MYGRKAMPATTPVCSHTPVSDYEYDTIFFFNDRRHWAGLDEVILYLLTPARPSKKKGKKKEGLINKKGRKKVK